MKLWFIYWIPILFLIVSVNRRIFLRIWVIQQEQCFVLKYAQDMRMNFAVTGINHQPLITPSPKPIDELIKLTGYRARKDYPISLRRITVWDTENQKKIILLTNHYDFGPTTINLTKRIPTTFFYLKFVFGQQSFKINVAI